MVSTIEIRTLDFFYLFQMLHKVIFVGLSI